MPNPADLLFSLDQSLSPSMLAPIGTYSGLSNDLPVIPLDDQASLEEVAGGSGGGGEYGPL